ncbi:thiamine diphosphokinase [Gymnodinialimonas hymeniacidonis]|uniref:thiamine diphosphokinase n=1 Tax=Gymnodinialimonas hymeniacidonis TaxID=3126508 RepID=UPI0034C66D36
MINAPDHGNNVDNEPEGCGLSLNFNAPVALVGGGFVGDPAFELSKTHAKIFVGVDGGGDEILRRGADPVAVIGDLDSFSAAGRAAIPSENLIHVAEQDSTDFEKALSRLSAPLILAIGFTGARLDHELAAMHALVRFPQQPVVLIGAEDVVLHLPAQMTLDLPEGTRVSLFPMDGVTVGLQGLEWSFEALDLHPARKIGTSNRASGGAVHLRADRPGCLLLLPLDTLEAVIAALAAADFHSPPA